MRIHLEHFQNLVESLMALPMIGKKGARSIALHLVSADRYLALRLAHAIESAALNVRTCALCGGLSENELCDICADERRDRAKLCIVLGVKDIFTLEENGFYDGRYFVYTGEEGFDTLEKLIKDGVQEVIFAFAPSIQNDALIYFIEERLSPFGLNFSKIAHGIPTGVNLENVDAVSLLRALDGRVKV
ncbi:MAG: recombination mediator RecR [Helicobacteraceae bacterium]|jgi:recombination protein RecR|nr:recombination mediator RecR [Helicobacteraceae bacterium]